jgi:hypothetical protein
VIDQVKSGCYTALDLMEFSTMAKGGASLAPLHGNEAVIPEATLDAMNERLDQINRGLYRVAINEAPPANTTVMQ